MRLHEAATLTENALAQMEASTGAGLVVKADKVMVDPVVLWLLVQTYRDHHNIHRPGPAPVGG